MGIVDPNPTFSATSTAYQPHVNSLVDGKPRQSPTLNALEARRQIQQAADEEMKLTRSVGSSGRRFLPIAIISQIITLQQAGHSAHEIEDQLKLSHGVVASLGKPGIVVSL
jgi:nucleotidyltransferase/DNA polymerase involved in DNA repair